MSQKTRPSALDAALKYLETRDRSLSEVHAHLEKREYAPEEIRAAIDKLLGYGFVNDLAFARRFIAAHPSNGRLLLRQKLRQRGVDAQAAEQALSELDEAAQAGQALDFLARRLRGSTDRDEVRRAMQAALRRGFPYGVVRLAVSRYNEQAAEELCDDDDAF